MARIAGVDLPRDKRIEIGLTYIYGIGLNRSHEILNSTGVNPDTRVKDLTDTDIAALRNTVATYQVEGDLRRWESMNIKRLMDIGTYRGRRHRSESSGSRTTDSDQWSHPQGRASDSCREEKGTCQEIILSRPQFITASVFNSKKVPWPNNHPNELVVANKSDMSPVVLLIFNRPLIILL